MRANVLQNNYGFWTWGCVDEDGNLAGYPLIDGHGFASRDAAILNLMERFPDLEPRQIMVDGASLGAKMMPAPPLPKASTASKGDPADIQMHAPSPAPERGMAAGTGDTVRNVSGTVRSRVDQPEQMPRSVVPAGGRRSAPDAEYADVPEVSMGR